VSPEELVAIDRSWADLCHRQTALVEHLESSFRDVDPTELAAARARWLVDAVAELVCLLPAPSLLGARARRLAECWPVAGTAPSFLIEGRAWMSAARAVAAEWTEDIERAWRHAWFLLSAVVAEEALSPFAHLGAERLNRPSGRGPSQIRD
jgi:hypothetical protein